SELRHLEGAEPFQKASLDLGLRGPGKLHAGIHLASARGGQWHLALRLELAVVATSFLGDASGGQAEAQLDVDALQTLLERQAQASEALGQQPPVFVALRRDVTLARAQGHQDSVTRASLGNAESRADLGERP